MGFFNTNKESGNTLRNSKAKVVTQDEQVMAVFESSYQYGTGYCNADDVLSISKMKCPITSIRRSLTNLTNEGKLIKTDRMKMGGYGKMTHLYTLNNTMYQSRLF